MKTGIIILLTIATTAAAQAGQMLVPGPQGLRYSRPFPTQPYYAPRPYYGGQRFDVGRFLAGAAVGAFLGAVVPRVFPPPPVMALTPDPFVQPDALDEVAPVNPQGITREEVGNALTDWCADPRNAPAPLCQKMGGRVQR